MLIKLKQIKGGIELQNDVEVLKEQSLIKEVSFEITSVVNNKIVLPSKPIQSRVIEVVVNGISYSSGRAFTVDYENNSILWTHSGFEIENSDLIVVHYSTLI